jgi:RNA polymerase sigma factor (sigma-70 family)
MAEASPCADCKTTGGYVRAGDASPRRSDGTQFGFDGDLCFRCYDKHYRRRKRAGLVTPPAPKPERANAPDIDPARYQWLVFLIAKEYAYQGMDYCDLAGYGQVGLMRAYRGFDPSKTTAKFETYAGVAIRQAIQRALATKVALIHVPEYLHVLVRKGVKPLDSSDRDECLRDAWAARSLKKVSECGLDEPLATIVYAREENPEHDRQEEAARKAAALLRSLPNDEATVLRLRFGIGHGQPRTQAEVAAAIGVSRITACRAEARAIEKLRAMVGGAA